MQPKFLGGVYSTVANAICGEFCCRCEKPVFQWQQPPQVMGSSVSPQTRRGLMPSSSKVMNLNNLLHLDHIRQACMQQVS